MKLFNLIKLFFLTSLILVTGCSVSSSSNSKVSSSIHSSETSSMTSSVSKYKYPEFADYYNIAGWDGTVCVWKINETTWKCGLMSEYGHYTLGNSLELYHMQNCIPCDFHILKEILETYSPYYFDGLMLFQIDYPTVFPMKIYKPEESLFRFFCDELGLDYDVVCHNYWDRHEEKNGDIQQNSSISESPNLASCSYCTPQIGNISLLPSLSSTTGDDFAEYRYEFFAKDHAFTSIWICCWQIEKDVWRCGLTCVVGVNCQPVSLDKMHMQKCSPCELNVMKEIILSYPSEWREYICVKEIMYPYERDAIFKGENYTFLREALGI